METRQFDRIQQRWYISRYSYEIVKNGVGVTEVCPWQRKKFVVPFENIAESPVQLRVSFKPAFWLALGMLALAIATGVSGVWVETALIWLAFSAGAALYFRLSFRNLVVYGSLVFDEDKPSHALLARFVGLMLSRRRDYLRQNYLLGSDLAALSADAIQKLVWLKQQGAISEVEFERLKADVIERSRWSVSQPPSEN